jgi:hypothetical protein
MSTGIHYIPHHQNHDPRGTQSPLKTTANATITLFFLFEALRYIAQDSRIQKMYHIIISFPKLLMNDRSVSQKPHLL